MGWTVLKLASKVIISSALSLVCVEEGIKLCGLPAAYLPLDLENMASGAGVPTAEEIQQPDVVLGMGGLKVKVVC